MNLELIKLSPSNEDREHFERINNEAFPSSQRMNFDEIFDFASDANMDVLGIYDEGTPVGFTVILKNSECGYIYFLAIDSRARSKGYGGATMKKMQEQYCDIQLILDFEEIDDSAENNEQRIRRKSFYLNNGFHETGNYTLLGKNRFEVVCTGGELCKEGLVDLIHILNDHCPEFLDELV
ncbi:GNAT family N-acetyltransferase [uncultured Eubacterium sp.]|uniref:GNAT family N-acetyltransferase n=1 Tax=uncultured Eubacterium sp. TaxID=165185 RepID=UPI002805D03B|nr:GNAT family N-acetyltransferase [uncultured Eubacterium sp.]